MDPVYQERWETADLVARIHKEIRECERLAGPTGAEIEWLYRAEGMQHILDKVIGEPTPYASTAAEQIRLLANRVGRADGAFFGETEDFYVRQGATVDGVDEKFAECLYELGVRVHPELDEHRPEDQSA